jgi:hypothetical protein
MQINPRTMLSALRVGLCTAIFLGLMPVLQAADPVGTWTWSSPGRDGGEPRKSTLKLKVEGAKLLGTITTPGRQGGDPVVTEISEGKVKDDEISFAVTREFNGNKFTMKYSGKIAGDTIKGKIESERDGNVRTREWEAKREAVKQ